MTDRPVQQPAVDSAGLVIGVAVGLPATVAAGALMALSRSLFGTTNAALLMMLVVVIVAAIGGRMAGIITALAAVVSFDFFHTRPYLSLTIDSRDDGETMVLLLIAGGVVGGIATTRRTARDRAGAALSEIRRVHRMAEAAASGRELGDVIQIAEDELRSLLRLRESRFEALPLSSSLRLAELRRSGSIEPQPQVRFAKRDDGRGGFVLPSEGVELPVLARGQQIGRFVLVPSPAAATTLDERMVAVAIADQVAAAWPPTP